MAAASAAASKLVFLEITNASSILHGTIVQPPCEMRDSSTIRCHAAVDVGMGHSISRPELARFSPALAQAGMRVSSLQPLFPLYSLFGACPPAMIINLAERAHNHNWELDPVIRSLLDTDFYKLLMLQFIWKHFPKTQVSFSLFNRHPSVRLADMFTSRN